MQKVCVTGMSCVCAAGTSCDAVWKSLVEGSIKRTSSLVLHDDALPYPFFAAPEEAFISGRRHSSADVLHLGLFAAQDALKQSKITEQIQQHMGIIIGTTAGSALHFLQGYAASRVQSDNASRGSTAPHQTIDIIDYHKSNLALSIANHLGGLGPVSTITNACTSGADAIGLAADMIRNGQCELILCGGADALSLVPHTGFARLMVYSDEPCRPFDADRRGLNLGEGAGMLVLESEAHAKARGAHILGYIAGYGSAVDAHHFTAPHPEARGLAKSVTQALAEASIPLENLAFINVHGTATMENDKVEGAYCYGAFPKTPVWASKGVTGHTLGAAGALEAIFCLMALQHRLVPRSHGFINPDPAIMLKPTQEHTVITSEYALSTSLGFGGGNAALVLKAVKNIAEEL